ncbi:MAG: SDR family NAD(P)-dependent oxidoreductase [Hymenobacter sp.]|nr:SDR family NAD(P)-dependent oxidoreductase [Hymenobacter sp.]
MPSLWVPPAASARSWPTFSLKTSTSYQLVLVDQDTAGLRQFADHLRTVHQLEATLITQDLSHDGAAQRVYDQVQAQGIAVDILVNDAGFGEYGPYLESDVARNRAVIHTNIVALAELTYLFGRDMVGRGKGKTRVISGITNKIQAMLSNVTPDNLIAAGMRRMFEEPAK